MLKFYFTFSIQRTLCTQLSRVEFLLEKELAKVAKERSKRDIGTE